MTAFVRLECFPHSKPSYLTIYSCPQAVTISQRNLTTPHPSTTMSNDAKSNNAASQDESLKDHVSTASTAPSSPVTAKSPVNTNEGDDLYRYLNLSRAGSYSPSSPWIAGTSAAVSRVSPLFTPWLITLCDRLPTTSMPPRPMPSGTSNVYDRNLSCHPGFEWNELPCVQGDTNKTLTSSAIQVDLHKPLVRREDWVFVSRLQ
jgi:hypothetical protein